MVSQGSSPHQPVLFRLNISFNKTWDPLHWKDHFRFRIDSPILYLQFCLNLLTDTNLRQFCIFVEFADSISFWVPRKAQCFICIWQRRTICSKNYLILHSTYSAKAHCFILHTVFSEDFTPCIRWKLTVSSSSPEKIDYLKYKIFLQQLLEARNF
jgi:hypothetical protein